MTTSWMLRLNYQCNVTNVWPAPPLRKTVAKQLLWDQPPKCSHSNRDIAFFPYFICCIHLQVCFVTGLSPGGGFQSLLHICCVTRLCLEEELTVWKDYLISCLDSITKYELRLMKSSQHSISLRLPHSNSKCFCRLWQSKGNLYNLPPHIWCDCELFWKIKYFYD